MEISERHENDHKTGEDGDDDDRRCMKQGSALADEDGEFPPNGKANKRSLIYNAKKPKWWYRLSVNVSKSQKRAMTECLETFRLPSVPHGEFLDWKKIFPPENQIWIEIGFGRGENLLALSHRKRNDPLSLVGMEVHRAGIGKLCQRIQKSSKRCIYWSDYLTYAREIDPVFQLLQNDDIGNTAEEANASNPGVFDVNSPAANCSDPSSNGVSEVDLYKNLRIWPGDGVKAFPKIPDSSVDALLITFPDPFPHESEKQWRVIQKSTLLDMYRILSKSSHHPGRLFLATDHEGFHRWSHDCINEFNQDEAYEWQFILVEPCPNRSEWLPVVSHYEQKGWEEGRQTHLSCWKAQ